MSESCKTCRFWHPSATMEENGECRRRAPNVPFTWTKRFPNAAEDDWCGEYEGKRGPLTCKDCSITIVPIPHRGAHTWPDTAIQAFDGLVCHSCFEKREARELVTRPVPKPPSGTP